MRDLVNNSLVDKKHRSHDNEGSSCSNSRGSTLESISREGIDKYAFYGKMIEDLINTFTEEVIKDGLDHCKKMLIDQFLSVGGEG